MNTERTVRETYLRAASFLQAENVSQDATRVSEWLLLHLLGWSRTEFFARWDEPFPSSLEHQWQHMLERKASGEPVQYITGEQQFMGLDLTVSPAVLIPRPETEVLVEHMIHLGRSKTNDSFAVFDIGTGSGAIPVSMAVMCPDWSFTAVDLSHEALEIAKNNAERHHVAERITFLQGDLLAPLEDAKVKASELKECTMLISNPPYIATEELSSLAPEVVQHEPGLALDGGDDGLTCYRKMLQQMQQMDFQPDLLGFEVGLGQENQVIDLLRAAMKWTKLEAIPDLTGRMRHVIGVK